MHPPYPDFLSIGQPLSGTRWLFDQLKAHPDTWLPPIKELHFLDHGIEAASARTKASRDMARLAAGKPVNHTAVEFIRRYLLDPICNELQAEEVRYLDARQEILADLPHSTTPLCDLITFLPGKRHFDWYGRLFQLAGGRLTGESTPSYCALSDEVINCVRDRFPDLKVILNVRHPVKRLESYLQKCVRQRICREEDLKIADRVVNLTVKNPLQSRFHSPSDHYRRWAKAFGDDRIHVILFDDLKAAPLQTREETYRFLGLDTDLGRIEIAANLNTKADREKCEIPPIATKTLEHVMQEEIATCKALFGGATKHW